MTQQTVVACVGVASLQNRTNEVLKRLDDVMIQEILADPICRRMSEKGRAAGVLPIRSRYITESNDSN